MRFAQTGKCRLPLAQNGSNSHANYLPPLVDPPCAWGRCRTLASCGLGRREAITWDIVNWLGDFRLVTRPSDEDVPLCRCLRAPDDWNDTRTLQGLQGPSMMPRTNKQGRLNLPHVLVRDKGPTISWMTGIPDWPWAHANSQTPGHCRPTCEGNRTGMGSEMGVLREACGSRTCYFWVRRRVLLRHCVYFVSSFFAVSPVYLRL